MKGVPPPPGPGRDGPTPPSGAGADGPAAPMAVPEADLLADELPAPRLPTLVRLFPVLGAGLALLMALGLWWIYRTDRPQLLPVLSTIGTLYVAGKEGGIPLGIAAGGTPTNVAMAIFGTDLAMTLLLYPLVHAAFDGVQRRRGVLGGMLRAAQKNANRRRKVVDQYGAIGIYVFMLVPFAFNSPLVGIALGRIAQLPPLRIMAVVGCAIATTTVGWTLLIVYGLGEVLHVSPWVPVAISLSVTAAVFAWGFVEARKEKALAQRAAGPPQQP
ncbi:MAG TPA: small multi-drug export protein [Candidatus Thermoplasmatota archaeon]|nr:small multi-drug export protein [Candidatus Thermoplasmatota archaeon]